jgi:hypothetical protein
VLQLGGEPVTDAEAVWGLDRSRCGSQAAASTEAVCAAGGGRGRKRCGGARATSSVMRLRHGMAQSQRLGWMCGRQGKTQSVHLVVTSAEEEPDQR